MTSPPASQNPPDPSAIKSMRQRIDSTIDSELDALRSSWLLPTKTSTGSYMAGKALVFSAK